MSVLNKLQPEGVFAIFEQLCAIPHGSRNTKAISDFCVKFAEQRGLRYIQDENNNVIIFALASAGMEHAQPVILQGHLDMVCEKTPDCDLDMEKQGLRLQTDGKWVWADQTTLGGDDGIAVAYALAILDDASIQHPPLEVILTVDEEIGMLGAASIDLGQIGGTVEKYHNIFVVYTKEAETADSYIERVTYELRGRRNGILLNSDDVECQKRSARHGQDSRPARRSFGHGN